MSTSKELYAEADLLEEQVRSLRKTANLLRLQELSVKPLLERLVFAAHTRCPCGAGLAYDPAADDPTSPFKGPTYWDCSAIMLGTADKNVKHTAQLPFAFYEVLSEGQPSANGATTRPTSH